MVALFLHGYALWWGMPASDAWDNDGIAPRDFLPGVAETFTPGQYFTYPPLHLMLLTLLTLPVTLTAAYRAGTTAVGPVLREIIEPPYMTAMAMTARVVSLLMSLGIVLALAKLAEELAGGAGAVDRERKDRAAVFTAWVAALGAPFTYYAHTSNLDVPYLFWGSLAALALARAVVRHETARLRTFGLFAACAVATKDQAYALFLVSVPTVIVVWFVIDPWVRLNVRTLLRDLVVAFVIAVAALLVIDGALFNPSGFRARLGFLSGSASQDFAQYARGWAGRKMILLDGLDNFQFHYDWPFALFLGLGFVSAVLGARKLGRSTLAASFLPLFVAASFTVCFNFVARRVEERFTLPQFLFASVYGGFGFASVWSARPVEKLLGGKTERVVVGLLRCAVIGVLLLGVHRSMTIDATLAREPRYQTEAFLEAHVSPGDVIEVHGLNTYLPRFPSKATIFRIGPTSVDRRGPLPNVHEIEAPYMAIGERRPTWIVVSMCFAWRYLERYEGPYTATKGRMVPTILAAQTHDDDATTFFRGLFGGTLGYREVDHAFVPDGGFFPRVNLHASLSCDTFVFLRDDVAFPSVEAPPTQ